MWHKKKTQGHGFTATKLAMCIIRLLSFLPLVSSHYTSQKKIEAVKSVFMWQMFRPFKRNIKYPIRLLLLPSLGCFDCCCFWCTPVCAIIKAWLLRQQTCHGFYPLSFGLFQALLKTSKRFSTVLQYCFSSFIFQQEATGQLHLPWLK